MAEVVITNGFLSVAAVDLSDHVRQMTLNYQAEPQDITAMSDTTRRRLGGLKDWSLAVEFNQDYAAAKVDATLFAQVGNSIALEVRPDAGAVAATNPKFTGNGVLESYQPVGGTVGEVHVSPVNFLANGTLARATV